jgi:hypothetical protein
MPMNPATALGLSNYILLGPSGGVMKIDSAVYDSALNTVTLRPRRRLDMRSTYYLRINGGGANAVSSSGGMALDGASTGVPGSPFVATLKGFPVTPGRASILKHARPAVIKALMPSGPAKTVKRVVHRPVTAAKPAQVVNPALKVKAGTIHK